ncbi:plasmid replication protein RepC [Segnochrobactrum spirostomi]|uniref:Replication initiation protein RepC n=1 Tax=Segnochrobactrum spirostomi TaxID=2608987 RepID=A0A6A7Y8P1_9HYPH|nr:plasmid replication protein RepC [Segnochrobactrum spirostomi]MQT14707.1 replication initiation protein RepC [Segnochrobactrum spirostomi]
MHPISTPTTPFGRRPMSLALVTNQAAAEACPPDRVVHKWTLFRTITEAKARLGISDRALTVLNALLTCHPELELKAGSQLVVYPSNALLTTRTHGMAEATLRRHMAALVDAGLVVRRDSPNGKRYAHRSAAGAVEQAFGFDLAPLVAREEEFEALAEACRQERRRMMLARERVTILRRDIGKLIALGLEEGIAADWDGFMRAFEPLNRRLPRSVPEGHLSRLASDLAALAADVSKAFEDLAKTQNPNGNAAHNDAQHQNSKTEPPFENEPGLRESRGASGGSHTKAEGKAQASFPLRLVLRACPAIVDYAKQGITTWDDLVETADLVRRALGVSPSAWAEAREAMGAGDAAITIAALLERVEEITSPGGYLRSLTTRARNGAYSVGPLIMSLLRAADGKKAAAS